MVNNHNEAAGPQPAATAGYKNPPRANQYKSGQSGNPHRQKSAIDSLKKMVMNAATRPVTVTDSTGKTRKAKAGEVLLERLFQQAIKGHAGATKQLLKFCEQYLPEYEEPPVEPAGSGYASVELSQFDVDHWRSQGFLPARCPYAVEDIEETDLTRAARAAAAAASATSGVPDEF
jgi:Family of unknown function (DUF5681)